MRRLACLPAHLGSPVAPSPRSTRSSSTLKDLHGAVHFADDVHLKRAALLADITLDEVRTGVSTYCRAYASRTEPSVEKTRSLHRQFHGVAVAQRVVEWTRGSVDLDSAIISARSSGQVHIVAHSGTVR